MTTRNIHFNLKKKIASRTLVIRKQRRRITVLFASQFPHFGTPPQVKTIAINKLMEVAPHLSVCLSKGFFIYGVVSALNITLMKNNGTTVRLVRQVSENMRKVRKFWE